MANASQSLCLVEFSNANVRFSKVNDVQFETYTKRECNSLSRFKRILVASDHKLQYIGCNYESETSKLTLSVLKVAIFNKRTRKIKFYDVELFHLKPLLKRSVIENTSDKSFREQSIDLALTFGSKNRKRALASKLKYQSVDNDSVTNLVPGLDIKHGLINNNVSDMKHESEIFPHQNKNATTVGAVYNIYDIILEETYYELEAEADIFTTATRELILSWQTEKKFCRFVINYLLTNLQGINLHNAKLLCYFHYMLFFLTKTYKDWKKKDPVPEVPQPFKKKLIERYILNRCFPQRMKDKLVADALVLALTINNYYVDANIFAASSGLTIKKLVLVAYALGCHVSEQKKEGTKLIELKLPLYKYEPRTFKRKS